MFQFIDKDPKSILKSERFENSQRRMLVNSLISVASLKRHVSFAGIELIIEILRRRHQIHFSLFASL